MDKDRSNITDSGERLTGTRTRSEKGETGSIRDDIDTNADTDTASEDIGSRSDLGVGE